MRYPILLTELLKATPPTHPDYQPLQDAHRSFASFVSNINNCSKLHDYLFTVSASVCGFPGLLQSWRYCIYYGRVFVNSLNTPSVGFLFNDRFCWMSSTCVFSLPAERCSYFLFEKSSQIRFIDVESFGPSCEMPRTYEIHLGHTVDYISFPEDEDYEQWVLSFQWILGFFCQLHKKH